MRGEKISLPGRVRYILSVSVISGLNLQYEVFPAMNDLTQQEIFKWKRVTDCKVVTGFDCIHWLIMLKDYTVQLGYIGFLRTATFSPIYPSPIYTRKLLLFCTMGRIILSDISDYPIYPESDIYEGISIVW